MKKAFAIVMLGLVWALNAGAQSNPSNPCVAGQGTNCTVASGPAFTVSGYDGRYWCVGEPITIAISPTLGLAGLIEVSITNEDCYVENEITPLSAGDIVSESWQVTGSSPSSGTGLTASFTPESCGTNNLEFSLKYAEPCNGSDITVTTNLSIVVVSVAALAPTNLNNLTLINSNATLQTFSVPVSTNLSISNLAVVATPCPAISPSLLPSCWSLDGEQTNITFVPLTEPGIFTVVCSAGTSAITNIIWVIGPNGDVEKGCSTNSPALLGYWSFNNLTYDWWPGQSNANDIVGTNNGTGHNITYTNGQVGTAFYFNADAAYIDFNTNVGNFGTSNFTIDFWIKTANNSQQSILGKRSSCGAVNMWDLRMHAAGDVIFEICQDSAGTDYANIDSQSHINDGIFHEVTISRIGTTLEVYIDGQLDNAVTTSAIANIRNNAMMTAGDSACTGVDGTTYLFGALDEVKLTGGPVSPWTGNSGQQPLADFNLQNPASPWGQALQVDTNVSANLSYKYAEDNGAVNINCINGAVSFWFKPDWNGGGGPGNPGRLLEIGDTNSLGGWWSLWIDSAASNLWFQTQSNGVVTTHITQSITNWSSNDWYQLVVNYSQEQTSLYTNGVLAATGPGMAGYPTIANRLEYGFNIGSDHNGQSQIHGTIDELYTFDCPLTSEEIQYGFDGYGGYPGTNENPAPSIITQPASQTISDGSSATFSVTAIGAPALNYQWSFNGAALPGATATEYTVSDVQASNAGSYVVVVTNQYGSVTSVVATLNRTAAVPTFIYQPIAQNVVEGDTVTFSARASGTEPISYQWKEFDPGTGTFTNLPGQEAARYVDVQMQAGDAGTYAVLVSNAYGTNFSTNGILTDIGDIASTVMPVFSPRQDYTFQAYTTYYIFSNNYGTNLDLYGTTTIQGGAVIKFDYDEGASYASLALHGPLVCQTGPYNPAILTSVDDDSQGEAPLVWWAYYNDVSSSTPFTAMDGCAFLNLDDVRYTNSTTISYLRFCYADQAVTTPTNSGLLNVWNCQFVQCGSALNSWATAIASTNRVHNALFSVCGTVFEAQTNLAAFEGEQITADVDSFWNPMLAPGELNLTNSIVLGDFGSGPAMKIDDVTVNPASDQFEQVDSGYYYLAKGSAGSGSGTTNISPQMLQQLEQKTTEAPLSLTGSMLETNFLDISGNVTYSPWFTQGLGVEEMTLFPAVKRYSGGQPDRGYYYDPLDYTVAAIAVTNQVWVLPGVSVGFRNDFLGGFFLQSGSTFVAQGTPTNPVVFADVEYVQEGPLQPGFVWQNYPPPEYPGTFYYYGGIDFFCAQGETNSDSTAPSLDFRFCDFYLTPDDFSFWSGSFGDLEGEGYSASASVYWTMRDCNQSGGQIILGQPTDVNGITNVYPSGAVLWTNNVFNGVGIELDPSFRADEAEYLGETNNNTNLDLPLYAINNCFKEGNLQLIPIPTSAGNWVFKNNLFDSELLIQDTNQPVDVDHNGYWPDKFNTDEESLLQYYGWSPPWQVLLELTNTSGSPAPVDDQILASTPPYETGPFGNFYMASGTILASAGSASASQLGLYEYTAHTNEIAQGNATVDIGAHYPVATNNGTRWQPVTSGGSQIPNYIEDIAGNGIIPTNASNPSSSLYSNIDLDGDGMVGTIEAALGKNPLVFDNPLILTNTSFGAGTATCEALIGYSLVTNVGQLVLMVDGCSNAAVCQSALNGMAEFVWDTSSNIAGQTYFLQPHLILKGSGVTADGPVVPFNQPAILLSPLEQTNGIGGAATFTATPAGAGPYTYQWYFGTNLVGTNSSLTLVNLNTNQSGTYTVVVTDTDGDPVTSSNALLEVENVDIGITGQPITQQLMESDDVTFAVTASGAPPLSYQWQMFDTGYASPTYGTWTNIPGATSTNLTTFNMQGFEAGSYSVLIANSVTNLRSASAVLVDLGPSPDGTTLAITGPRQNYTFRGDRTYVIGSPYAAIPTVDLYGPTTIEGRSVIRFYTETNASISVHGTVNCKTGPYEPAILTSVDDFSQGEIAWETIPNIGSFYLGSGTPQMADNRVSYLNLDDAQDPGGTVLSYLRFCYADQAVTTPTNSANLQVWDCQFYDCDSCLNSQLLSGRSTNGIHNALFGLCNYAIAAENTNMEVHAEQVTADVVSFWNPQFAPSKVCLTNAIVVGSFGTGLQLETQAIAINPADSPFEPAEDGSYYLALGSSCRGAGTAGISAQMSQQLRGKTTWAPTAIPNGSVFIAPTILSPTVPRYNGGAPDMGFYYDALDLTVGAVMVSNQVTIVPGTAIGVQNAYLGGFFIAGGNSLISEGSPTNLITYSDLEFVEEGPFSSGCAFNWYPIEGTNDYGGVAFFVPYMNGASSTLKMDYCQMFLTEDDSVIQAGITPNYAFSWGVAGSIQWTMRDSAIQGGYINLGPPATEDYSASFPAGSVTLANNLFQYVQIQLAPSLTASDGNTNGPNVDMEVQAWNNLFRQGSLALLPETNSTGSNWVFTDNSFDREAFLQNTSQPLDYSYDAYWPISEAALPNTQSLLVPVLSWDVAWNVNSEFSPTTTGDGTIDGLDNQTNTSSRVYDAGLFGAFYQSSGSPLLHAGSRSATSAGLGAFTVLTNGPEEGSSTVSIGLHYVATNGAGIPFNGTNGLPDWWNFTYGTTEINATNLAQSADGYTVGQSFELGLDPTISYSDPMIIEPPLNQQAYVGNPAAFSVVAGGTAPLSYQWDFNGNPIAGATASSLVFSSVQLTNAGEYSVTVTSINSSDDTNQTVSPAAMLTVLSDFTLAIAPSDAVDPGWSAQFTVSSVISVGTTYQWYFDGNPIPAATGSVYLLTNAQQTNAGHYSVSINGASPTNSVAYFGVLQGPPLPIANPAIVTLATNLYWSYQINVLQNDSVTVGTLIITNTGLAGHGNVTTDGQYIYYSSSDANYVGPDSFTYTVTDGLGVTSTSTVTIFFTPDGNNYMQSGDLNIILQTNNFTESFDFNTNGWNPGTNILVYSVENPSLGTVNTSGSTVTYFRNTNLFGPDTFNYTIMDTNGNWAQGTITVDQTNAAGDGIPDQWKLIYGLSTAADISTNDPDTDGLPNMAEYLLHTDPLVSNNMFDLTTTFVGEKLSGEVLIPLGVATNVNDNAAFELDVDGVPAAAALGAISGSYFIEWDTQSVSNGTHQVAIRMSYPLASGNSISIFGKSATVNVFNPITVNPVSRWFENSLTINASLNIDARYYQVAIYDRATGESLKTLSGSVVRGNINDNWSYEDEGVNVTGPLICEFDLSMEPYRVGNGGRGENASLGASTVIYKTRGSITDTSYTVAWGFDSAIVRADVNNEMIYGVIDPLDTLSDSWIDSGGRADYTLLPQIWNTPYGNAFELTPNSFMDSLFTNSLKDPTSAHFYWHGHGSPSKIGPMANGSWPDIKSSQVATLLGNNWWGTAAHPYRLVILDGCNSFSTSWANAFGIPTILNSTVAEFTGNGIQPQAFVAWECDLPFQLFSSDISAWGSCVRSLNAMWMMGRPLYICMNAYTVGLVSYGGIFDGLSDYQRMPWPWHNTGGNPIPYSEMDYRIYGCIDLSSLSE